ncbi:MAG: hypothetical protein LBE27_05420 [Deltaproteobacteria bacterium]|jgi:hypothetical protein|nr:hypothetical protein [Deltaproteobacteria bacterium]
MMLLSDAIDTFLKDKKNSEGSDVYHSYVNSLGSFQKFIEVNVDLEEIDSYDIACYLDNHFQDGMDLDMAVLELHCIQDFMNWACDAASIDKVFGMMTMKERNSKHPFFSLLNHVLELKEITQNFMYWAIFVWATKKTDKAIEDVFSEKNLLKNRTYTFIALVGDDSAGNSDLLSMDNYCYYGGPVSGVVTITNQAGSAESLSLEDIIKLFRKYLDSQETVAEINRKLQNKKASKFVPSNLKKRKGAKPPTDSAGKSFYMAPTEAQSAAAIAPVTEKGAKGKAKTKTKTKTKTTSEPKAKAKSGSKAKPKPMSKNNSGSVKGAASKGKNSPKKVAKEKTDKNPPEKESK